MNYDRVNAFREEYNYHVVDCCKYCKNSNATEFNHLVCAYTGSIVVDSMSVCDLYEEDK